jgi:hypothetical protein
MACFELRRRPLESGLSAGLDKGLDNHLCALCTSRCPCIQFFRLFEAGRTLCIGEDQVCSQWILKRFQYKCVNQTLGTQPLQMSLLKTDKAEEFSLLCLSDSRSENLNSFFDYGVVSSIGFEIARPRSSDTATA